MNIAFPASYFNMIIDSGLDFIQYLIHSAINFLTLATGENLLVIWSFLVFFILQSTSMLNVSNDSQTVVLSNLFADDLISLEFLFFKSIQRVGSLPTDVFERF